MSHLDFARLAFGVPQTQPPPAPARLDLPAPGLTLALVGPSGAGKTRALDALARETGAARAAPLTRQQLARPVLELFDAGLPSAFVLRTLATAGLSDATLWPRKACTLSMGEQRRLEVALALSQGGNALLLDEFDAHLDCATALALACALRKLVQRRRLRLVVSTHRPELLKALAPWRVLEISGSQALERPGLVPAAPLELLHEFTFSRGSLRDYPALCRFHYLGSARPGPVTDVFVARLHGELAAMALFGMPHLFLGARNQALPACYSSQAVARGGAKLLNRDVRLLQRVVVHPRFRALGLASSLIAQALPQLGVCLVECLAEMGEFSGFLLRAGFELCGRCKPSREAARLLSTLERLGLKPEQLLETAGREACLARLPARERARLERQLKGLCRSRIETGHGALRGRTTSLDEAGLRRALVRLRCRPEYFLWRRKG